MDFRQLTTFRVLAATLNFHQAAERLNYVQSTVSAQIQALEEELGTRLFDRLGKSVVLTDAGARLLPTLSTCARWQKRLAWQSWNNKNWLAPWR